MARFHLAFVLFDRTTVIAPATLSHRLKPHFTQPQLFLRPTQEVCVAARIDNRVDLARGDLRYLSVTANLRKS